MNARAVSSSALPGRFLAALLLLLPPGLAVAVSPVHAASDDEAVAAAKSKRWTPLPLDGFSDGIHHALMRLPDERAPYERHRPDQIVHIGENLLAWQNGDGGWPENVDWLKTLSPAELAKLPRGRPGRKTKTSTLDNRNTWSQIDYLARLRRATGLARYGQAAIRGIDYLLDTQRASGGWRGADVDAITFNDDVMVGVLRTLRDVAEKDDLYEFVDSGRRRRAKAAYERGIACILKCQIRVRGRLTAWCQQHSHDDYRPIWARSFEPPSITAGESVEVVRLLMAIDHPSPQVVRAVQAATAWFDKVKIQGLRLQRKRTAPVSFRYHYTNYDVVEVKDPAAPPLWARFYDLETEEPFFCDRDRKITTHYAEVSRERRTGYAYYGDWPAQLLAVEYPAWQEKWTPEENVLARASDR